jgi:hypothetical protein
LKDDILDFNNWLIQFFNGWLQALMDGPLKELVNADPF